MHGFFRLYGDYVTAALLLLVCSLIFLFPNPLAIDDGLRHFAMARYIAELGEIPPTGWSGFFYAGYLQTANVDPWLLSDLLLVPLASFPVPVAIKIFTLASVAFIIASALYCGRSLRMPVHLIAVALIIVLAGESLFSIRLFLGRPYVLQTGLILFFIAAVLRRQFWVCAILMCIALLLSQLFVFLVAIFALSFLWLLAQKRNRDAVMLALCVILGAAIGLLLHPQTAEYSVYIYDVFLRIPFLNKEAGLSQEMQPGTFSMSATSILFITGFIVLCTLLDIRKNGLRTFCASAGSLLLACTLLFLPMFFVWVRAIDMLWPILIITAFYFYHFNQQEFMRTFAFIFRSRWLWLVPLFFLVMQISITLRWSFKANAAFDLREYSPLEAIPATSRVLNPSWSHFAPYVLINPRVRYVAGIDPSFSYISNPEGSAAMRNLYDNFLSPSPEGEKEAEILLNNILTLYPSDYLVLDSRYYGKGVRAAEKMTNLELVRGTSTVKVYKIK